MNLRHTALPGLLLTLLFSGCISSGRRGDPQESAALERARVGTAHYLKPDGSLDLGYLWDATMPFAGVEQSGPVFDPVPLNGRTR